MYFQTVMLIGVFLTGSRCFLRWCPHNGVFCASGRCFLRQWPVRGRRMRRRSSSSGSASGSGPCYGLLECQGKS